MFGKAKKITAVLLTVLMVAGLLPATLFGGIVALTADAEPELDLLFCAFDLTSSEEDFNRETLARRNILENDGKATLRTLNNSVALYDYTGSAKVTAEYSAGRGIESIYSSNFTSTTTNEVDKQHLKLFFITFLDKQEKELKRKTNGFSHSQSYESFFSIMKVHARLGTIFIEQPKTTIPDNIDIIFGTDDTDSTGVFKKGFKKALLGDDYDDLFDTYGTHFLSSYHLGAYAETVQSVVKTEDKTETSKSTSLITDNFEASPGFNIPLSVIGDAGDAKITTNADSNLQKNNTSAFERLTEKIDKNEVADHKTAITYNISGGTPMLIGPDSTISEYNAWLATLNWEKPKTTTEILIDDKLEFIGIWELLPYHHAEQRMKIREAYENRARIAENRFFEQYVNSKVVPLASDMPMPSIDGSYTIISTEAQLRAVSGSGNYILSNDITLTGAGNWTPINGFTGILDGNGNTIRNVTITGATKNLFGNSGGTFKNLAVSYNTRASFVSRVNGIAGASAIVDGCYAELAFDPQNSFKDIPASLPTAGQILIDLSSATAISNDVIINKTVTVGAGVDAIKFKGHSTKNYRRLAIVVQGDTELIFEDFSFDTGLGILVPAARTAITLNGTNSAIISTGSLNEVIGVGSYNAIEAANNLVICGDANLTVNHSTRKGGMAAIKVNGTLDIDIDAKLTAKGSDGTIGEVGVAVTTAPAQAKDSTSGKKASDGAVGYSGNPGGNGGSGGDGIRANKVNIIGVSVVNITGGDGGNGGKGGQGGKGGRGGNGWARPGVNNEHAGNGGQGGQGGIGGKGGSPFANNSGTPLPNSSLIISTSSKLVLKAGTAGTGGKGGDGGDGGTYGECKQYNLVGHYNGTSCSEKKGNRGVGGKGGDGGNPNGSFISVSGAPAPQDSGGKGGSGGDGEGTLGAGKDNSSSEAKMIYSTDTVPYNKICWTRSRIVFKESVARTESEDHVDELVYHPGEIFDTSALKSIMKAGDKDIAVKDKDISVLYNFSALGKTLVTITYFNGGGRHTRYIPVTVTKAEVTDVKLVLPRATNFFVGDTFDHEGLALEVYYYGGGYETVAPDNVSIPSNITGTTGEKTVTATYTDKFGKTWNLPYTVSVGDDKVVGIRVVNNPTTSEYYEGTALKTSGLTLGCV